ncbi:MAG TPA: hypothetical protein VF088_01450 [Pyrinomonadaceae bacterium]
MKPMKVLVVVLVFGNLVSFASPATQIQELQETVAVKPKVADLGVSLAANKHRYSRREQIKLEVKLTNTDAVKDVFVYGTLELGHRGSFTLYLRDAKGKEVPPRIILEALESLPEPGDKSAFVKLLPFHFIGTEYGGSIPELNMDRPGRYSIWVEYHCPISTADVQLSPFWGKENGTIKSNVVEIEVLP